MNQLKVLLSLIGLEIVLVVALFARIVSTDDIADVFGLGAMVLILGAVIGVWLVWLAVLHTFFDGKAPALPSYQDDDRLRPPTDPPARPWRRGEQATDPWTPYEVASGTGDGATAT